MNSTGFTVWAMIEVRCSRAGLQRRLPGEKRSERKEK